MKNRFSKISDFFKMTGSFILKYGKYFFPGFALILAAAVVVLALNIRKTLAEKEAAAAQEQAMLAMAAAQEEFESTDVPLEASSDELLEKLIKKYYECLSNGDSETLISLCDTIDDSELFRYMEQSNYLSYSLSDLYTQVGPVEGSYVAYAYCFVTFDEYSDVQLPAYNGFYIKTNENGDFYIVKGLISDEENDYIAKVISQDDVVELNNRINVEYNEVILEHQDILDYLLELDVTVSTAVGEKVAQLNASIEPEEEAVVEDVEEQPEDVLPEEEIVKYVTALKNVNIRASDSTNSDRLGEAQAGQRFELVEELANGWTKLIYNGEEAFIKSEFLSVVQSASSAKTVGMLTAVSEVNIRSIPDSTGERLGALLPGESLELVAVENGWCSVKYDDILAYVITDCVEYTLFDN